MGTCTAIAVDFDTKRVDRNGQRVWDTRLFRPDEEEAARAFFAEMQKSVTSAISKRMALIEGHRFRVEWVTDAGGVLCESEGQL
jgi:hypothetical protein